jgi:hypothetical protein
LHFHRPRICRVGLVAVDQFLFLLGVEGHAGGETQLV